VRLSESNFHGGPACGLLLHKQASECTVRSTVICAHFAGTICAPQGTAAAGPLRGEHNHDLLKRTYLATKQALSNLNIATRIRLGQTASSRLPQTIVRGAIAAVRLLR
jgi:hypothetical protein